jgi:type I restriction enzyme M protein
MTKAKVIVDKLWNYCNLLRDDGLSYGDYLGQLTYLLFLKMAEERRATGHPRIVPEGLDWESLLARSGELLHAHYLTILQQLGQGEDMLGVIFRRAQNRIQDPHKLERLIKELIDEEQWTALDTDVKGAAYEGLLERNAADTKSGAGQYFTPRPLIQAIVEVMQPKPGMKICDPACGTGGFLLAAHDYIRSTAPPDAWMSATSFVGWEIVEDTARLCAMNLLLHGIASPENPSPVHVDDALRADPGIRFDMVLTNPPFGRRSSVTILSDSARAEQRALTMVRDDFWVSTSNKQLNFVQHVKTLLDAEGRAAVIVPDNVLFEGGAGEKIRRHLLQEFDVHTLLRLPTGIFYAGGVKANVLFFDRPSSFESPATKALWVYDLRTDMHFTLKTNTLERRHLDDFVRVFKPGARTKRRASDRFRRFTYADLLTRDRLNLDITWAVNDAVGASDPAPSAMITASEIMEEIEAALLQMQAVVEALPSGPGVAHGLTMPPPSPPQPPPPPLPRKPSPGKARRATPKAPTTPAEPVDARPEHVEQPLHERILEVLRRQPSMQVEELRHAVDVEPGRLQAELATLLRAHRIREVREGGLVRIHPA